MRYIPIIQFGVGGVGRALIRQVLATAEQQARYGFQFVYTALADSDGAVVATRHEDEGLARALLEDLVEWKAAGKRLAEHPEGYWQGDLAALVDVAGWPGAIVVDVTAAEAETVAPAFQRARDLGYGIVLANKKPLTGDLRLWDLLHAGPLRYEATVGAGLPVISTLRTLLDTGDSVKQVQGALSGTLGFVMSALEAGQSFSAAVREAHRLGYTEPDPRDDLSGMDVARKALILARTLGLPLSMDTLTVEPLYPPDFAALSRDEFLARLDEVDAEMQARVASAAAEGNVLRYVADVSEAGVSVGVQAVPRESPLGALRGTDNLISFTTARYAARPLVVQGAGAGVDVTAAGVLGDMFQLAQACR
nr:MAG: homoserine dehydrogenase [Ardenticatenia bacterium]